MMLKGRQILCDNCKMLVGELEPGSRFDRNSHCYCGNCVKKMEKEIQRIRTQLGKSGYELRESADRLKAELNKHDPFSIFKSRGGFFQ